MSVVFESRIKVDENDKWFIELQDMVDNRIVKCYNLDEYSKSVEDFGSDYGGHIDEVKWSKDENVPEQVMDEIRFGMAQQQEEIKKQNLED